MIAKRIDTTTNITTFNDTLEDNIDIKLEGNTIQDGTPTPDSPIDIQTVNGDNTISVLGKNFYNYVDSFVASINGLTNTLNDDGSITTTGVPSGNYKIINNAVDITNLLEDGQKYTMSQTNTNTYLYMQINLVKRDGGTTEYIGTKNTRTYTFTVNKTVYKTYSIRIQTTSTSEWGSDSRTITNFYQLEKGEQATAFEKYQGAEYPINLPVENFFPTDKNAWEQGTISASTGENQDSTTRLRTIDYYPIKSNTNYFISLKLTGYQFVNILLYDSSKTFVGAYNSYSSLGQRTKQINVLSSVFPNVEYMRVTLRKTDSSTITIDDIDNLKPQMEYGTRENTSYPYGTTPIELCKIGNYKDYLYRTTGKNLLPFPYKDGASKTHRGITFTAREDGSVLVNGTATGNADYKLYGDYLEADNLELFGNYIYGGSSDIVLRVYNNTGGTYTDLGTDTGNGAAINTSTYKKGYIELRVSTGTTINNRVVYPMVLNSLDNVDYEKHGSKNEWYIKKNIGKVVLNGTESWSVSSGTFYCSSISDYSRENNTPYCFYFKGEGNKNDASGMVNNNTIAFNNGNTYNRLYIKASGITANINGIKNWLASNNTLLYYLLAIPSYEKITNTTLVNQLEQLKNANSYDKQTTIGQPVANAFFNLSINYPERPTNFIEECKNGAYCNRYGKLEFDGLTINQSNQLVDFKIDSGCYDNGDIIGNTYVKKIEANLLDSVTDDLVDKEFEVSVGATFTVNNVETTEYVDLGTFNVEKPTDTQTENRTSLIGYDQLLNNLDKVYTTDLDYENDTITIGDVYEELCTNLGLVPVTTIFTNSDITVEGNPFTNGEKNREVLKSIEKVSCSFVDIDTNTNEIKLKWLSNNLDYTFEKSDYSTLEGGKLVYGPINTLIIRGQEIESENVAIADAESIAEYGEQPFTIIEDYFLYDETKRQAALNNIWNKVHGLTYTECKLTTLTGKPFLTVGDKIRVITGENEYFDTYILKHSFTFNGAFMSEIESPVLTQQEVQTKQDISLGEKLRNTQIIVNKQKGEITSLVSATETLTGDVANATDLAITASTTADSINTDLQQYKQTVSTQFTQTNQDFTFQFSSITDLVNQMTNVENDHYNELHRYIRFINGIIQLGQSDSDLTAELSNTELAFKQNGQKVAYISNDKMYIRDVEITNSFIIGNFGFTLESNDSVSFGKVK